MRSTLLRRTIVGLLAAVTAAALLPAPADADGSYQCVDESVPVSAAGDSAAQISGTLCLPAGAQPGTIQLLVPGATYNRVYWDFPNRSYARYAAAHGQAVFAVDRLDTGTSTQVSPVLLTVQEDASSMHQVIGTLRSSGLGGHRFSRVILAGHSLGSIITVTEAATYHDVDGVVLTGLTHFVKATFAATLPLILKPTTIDGDPTLANRPVGELTIDGPDRQKSFYAPGDTDPAVVAEDTATRDVLSTGELASFPTYLLDLSGITAPTLVAVGSEDAIFGCGPLAAGPCPNSTVLANSERPHLPNVSSLSTFVLAGAGHDINLSNKYQQWFAAMIGWAAGH